MHQICLIDDIDEAIMETPLSFKPAYLFCSLVSLSPLSLSQSTSTYSLIIRLLQLQAVYSGSAGPQGWISLYCEKEARSQHTAKQQSTLHPRSSIARIASPFQDLLSISGTILSQVAGLAGRWTAMLHEMTLM